MQGIILAAGMGKRLKNLTNENAKCMVKVNGISMIERALQILEKKHLSRIVIVVGYKAQNLIDYISTLKISTPICFLENSIYDKTNNIYSLVLAGGYLCEEDTLLLESDLVFEESVIDTILNDPRESLALVDKFESWMDGTCMELDEEDRIVDFISGKCLKFTEKEKYYKTVNIYKFSANFSKNIFVPFLMTYESVVGENEYYESVIKFIILLETTELRAKRLEGQIWYEIDNIQDLNIAESLFTADEEEHYDKISCRYGGLWRYPKLLDFCYLINPYYPPEKMKEEMKSNFETLLTDCPSGMKVNTLLVAGALGIKAQYIVVGNGAAELIKYLMEEFKDSVIGCIYPTFEEYPDRLDKDNIIYFKPNKGDFQYTVDELIEFYSNNPIETLILINPDNPSGNYIPYDDTIKLISWCREKVIRLIVDESFVDFVDLDNGKSIDSVTLLKEEVLQSYNNLYVIKSISNSYGVAGVRLGILATSDEDIICTLKKAMSIWNINSFGEFFLQIKEKYDKDYVNALVKIRKCRTKFIGQLNTISFLEVYPSQSNYVMCRVNGITAKDLCCQLLKHNIFIKNITNMIGDEKQYIRLAVRDELDNRVLIEELRKIEFEIS